MTSTYECHKCGLRDVDRYPYCGKPDCVNLDRRPDVKPAPVLTKDVNPWELIHDKTISQLVFAYEAVLTEMRTHAKVNATVRNWVARLDYDRDEFVKSMLVKPDEPRATRCNHPPEARDLTWCRICGQTVL